jgi:hypothetical protein
MFCRCCIPRHLKLDFPIIYDIPFAIVTILIITAIEMIVLFAPILRLFCLRKTVNEETGKKENCRNINNEKGMIACTHI